MLGAGLQGTCVAMDMASTGLHVDLFDRNSACMTQASRQNEGKVHLGYVFANDRSLRSAVAMTDGAATFGPLLQRWLEQPMSRLGRSTSFNYAVHRDSMISVSDFEHHLHRTHALGVARIAEGDYLGMDIRTPQRLSAAELEVDYDPDAVKAVYRTGEVSVDPLALAVAVRERVAADPLIRPFFETEVHGVQADGDRMVVHFENAGDRSSDEYDHVVNALWDGRLVVDATIGLVPERSWLFRVKHYLKLNSSVAARLPSTTIVLGPFGDVVDYGDGGLYLSWYPSGMRASSSELRPPDSIRYVPDDATATVRDGIVNGLASVVPGVGDLPETDLTAAELEGGVIFAWGTSDIDDIASGLHKRFAIGPTTVGRYHSVDTGKLTTAPLYARMVADRVRAGR